MSLMVVTVSAMFAACWGADGIVHSIDDAGSLKLNPLTRPMVHLTVTFNYAVNPFVHALINQRFRTKMKEMICYVSRSDAAKEPRTTKEVPLEHMGTGNNTGTEPNGTRAVTGLQTVGFFSFVCFVACVADAKDAIPCYASILLQGIKQASKVYIMKYIFTQAPGNEYFVMNLLTIFSRWPHVLRRLEV